MAKEARAINEKIDESYNNLKARVGKYKADELITRFKHEAFCGREVNHEYMIRKMDSYEDDNTNQ